MLDLSTDIAPPRPVRLADYRPPLFLIDTVDLVFELGAENTRVKSRLGMRRNPAVSERGAALQLDGEALELVSLALDGEPSSDHASDALAVAICHANHAPMAQALAGATR